MKEKLVLFYLLFLTLAVHGQNSEAKSRALVPLDWQTIECGRPIFGSNEKCHLTIFNNTDKVIQGYRITHYGEFRKFTIARISPRTNKQLERYSNDIWVFADTLHNMMGGFKLLPGRNTIIIDSTLFSNSRKLNRQITNSELPGTSSGGQRIKEQEAYDVLKYDLKLEILPKNKYIQGSNVITARVLNEINNFVFDLDTLLQVKQVLFQTKNKFIELPFALIDGKYWATLPFTLQKNQTVNICVVYEGHPRESTHAPYKGGFSWNTTNNCQPWIATSCQVDGADLWFPCKDYQWDEADSVDLSFTVPKGLRAISNGVLTDSTINDNGTVTFNWKVINPINNYGIALNIAPFQFISDNYTDITGEVMPIGYWVLPENIKRARSFYPYSKKYLKFLESHLGPYPFRNEKLAIIEVPFVGMEHQTIIAMGLNQKLQYPEYNKTLFHELCHEWFGNMVTASDWNSFWIHESFVGYMELLYEESVFGEDAYARRIKRFHRFIRNKIPLAPKGHPDSREIYNGDSYSKGTFLLHSLRYIIGKDNLLRVIRRMVHPDNSKEYKTDGTQCRFTSTEDFFEILELVTQQDFKWFEEIYFKKAEIPTLEITEDSDKLHFKWKTVDNIEFNMPLEIKTADRVLKIDFNNNLSTCKISRNEIIKIDPNNWILKKVQWLTPIEK